MALKSDLDINRRFLLETEQAIRLANNEIIHMTVPPLNSDRMITFAVAIAKLRAKYIEAAFQFADVMPADDAEITAEVEKLELYRRQYEAARDAFVALQRAIELGYVTVEHAG
jgi:hypothetical protein